MSQPNVELLLDENLSPTLRRVLRREALDVVHIRDRSLTSATDADVLEWAHQEDRTLVTAHAAGFVKRPGAHELHAGIARVEVGDLLRSEQEGVVRQLVRAIERE